MDTSSQRANMGFIGAIVAVATIGGFLFGYDSGAVNGTQDGLKQAFHLIDGSWSPRTDSGFTVGLPADRLLHRRVLRRPPRRLDRTSQHDDARSRAVPGRSDRAGHRGIASHLSHRADLRRHGGRRGERAVARLHLRSRARQHPRPSDDRPADHDHHGPDRSLRRQLFPRQECRCFDRPFLGRHRGLALDVPDAGDPGRDLPRRAVLHPGEPALSRFQGPRRPSRRRC